MRELIVVGDNLAFELAKKINKEAVLIEERIFPDGEIKPRFKKEFSTKTAILIIQKKQKENINDYLLRFYLLSRKLRENSQKVIGILPYLPYARQDAYFQTGDPLSLKYVAELIEKNLDVFLTINMHQHRKKINEVFSILAYNLSVFSFYAEKYFLKKARKTKNLVLVGPDEEAKHFIDDFRQKIDLPYFIFHKKRDLKTGKVSFAKPDFDFMNKEVLILDDIISSGGTILQIIKILQNTGVKSLNLGICHALFSSRGLPISLRKLRFQQIIVSNSVENSLGGFDITQVIASFLKKQNKIMKIL